jgi:hypothetical protein
MNRTCLVAGIALLTFPAAGANPKMGGPMKHIAVGFDGQSLTAWVDPAVPTPGLQNYEETYSGAAAILNGKMYNAQYGWMIEGFWQPPEGSLLWITRMGSTPGLAVYRGDMQSQNAFAPIFTTDGSSPSIAWNGAMLHNWYAVEAPGDYASTYKVYFGDAMGNALDSYGSADVMLEWTGVPGPASISLAGIASMAFMGVGRRRG